MTSKRKIAENSASGTLPTECRTPSAPDTSQIESAHLSNRHFQKMKKVIDMFVSSTLSKGIFGLRQEFCHLKKMQKPEVTEFRHWCDNPDINRYRDIFCLDKTRVLLSTHSENHDYIHANYVSSPINEKRWICTQAPLSQTIYDFWLMIFEQQTMAVLQLCKFVEQDQEKCAIYYPKAAGEESFFKEIRIKCNSVQTLATQGKVVQRIFSIYRENVGKDVYHLSVEDWPDHGVPEADTTLLHVLQKIRTCVNRPIVVHCSAGIGRTGTIVAIENVLETLMSGKEVSIYNVVIRMRQERAHSVQRESQYLLITRLVLEYLIQVNQISKTKELETFFEEYEKVTSQGGSQRI